MNILIDRLPQTVEIGGEEFLIESDFRTSILFELLMQDADVPDDRKAVQALRLYYTDGIPPDTKAAVEAILWFYKCGKQDRTARKGEAAKNAGEKEKRIYSFDYDDSYIFAAFLTQYGIDLNRIKYLHWWKFRAMFNSLDEKCEFCKIMGYRSVKITGKMSKEQKAFYRRMKEIHALPLPQDEVDKADAITQALMNGGDLSGLL